jgi:hypothetical protein
MFALRGQEQIKLTEAGPGDTVALGRLDEIGTGERWRYRRPDKTEAKAETLTRSMVSRLLPPTAG